MWHSAVTQGSSTSEVAWVGASHSPQPSRARKGQIYAPAKPHAPPPPHSSFQGRGSSHRSTETETYPTTHSPHQKVSQAGIALLHYRVEISLFIPQRSERRSKKLPLLMRSRFAAEDSSVSGYSTLMRAFMRRNICSVYSKQLKDRPTATRWDAEIWSRCFVARAPGSHSQALSSTHSPPGCICSCCRSPSRRCRTPDSSCRPPSSSCWPPSSSCRPPSSTHTMPFPHLSHRGSFCTLEAAAGLFVTGAFTLLVTIGRVPAVKK